MTVCGDSIVTYRLLLELNVPRGEKQHVLARSILIGNVLVVSALLIMMTVPRLLSFLMCCIGVDMLAEALPRVYVQALMLLACLGS